MLTLPSSSSPSSSLSPLFLCQKREKSESERLLTEQLQAKELELLQLKTEMETSQGTGRAHRVAFVSLYQQYFSRCTDVHLAKQILHCVKFELPM